MKSNIKKKSGYIINICLILLIFMSVPGQAVSGERTIEKNVLTAGNGTDVTVIIRIDNIQQSLSIKESIPGWSLTRISDDADQFKATTNEWLWIKVENNTVKTVKYRLTVPPNTTSGVYTINGIITTSNGTTSIPTGTIQVTSSSGSGSSSSGSSGDSTYPTTTATPKKNETNVTATPTETFTAQPTATVAEQTIDTPVKTVQETPVTTTTNKSPGFSIIFSIGIIATIYILRRMK
jgi:hypothetical protein